MNKQKGVHKKLLKKLKNELQSILDSRCLGWGCIYKYDFKEEFDLPFGGHTAHKIFKGHHVGRNTIIKALEHFEIDYKLNYGFIDIDNEE